MLPDRQKTREQINTTFLNSPVPGQMFPVSQLGVPINTGTHGPACLSLTATVCLPLWVLGSALRCSFVVKLLLGQILCTAHFGSAFLFALKISTVTTANI